MKREWDWMLENGWTEDEINDYAAKMFVHWVKKTHPRIFNDLLRAYKRGQQ